MSHLQIPLSLVATIRNVRPDLLIGVTEGNAISEQMPESIEARTRVCVEDLGEPMTACFLTKTNTDPTNW